MFSEFHQYSEFQKIASIIEKNDVSAIPEIRQLILRNPNCLLQTNSKKETLLHLAAESACYAIFNEIVMFLGDKVQNAIRKFTVDGLLPIHYASENSLPDKKIIYKKLEELICSAQFKPMKESIDFKQIVLENLDEIRNDKTLLFKLHYAWIAASFARKIISSSFTHMSTNLLNDAEFKKLNEATNEFENIINQIFLDISTMRFASPDEESLFKLEKLSAALIKHRMGNCLDYSILVLWAFKLMGIKHYPVIHALKDIDKPINDSDDNSDHAFVVLFDKKRTDHYMHWKTEIVIDAWSGKIYMSKAIVNKLHDLKTAENLDSSRVYNLACGFDPELQTLSIDLTFNLSDEFWKKNISNDFSSFADIEGIKANLDFIHEVYNTLMNEATQANTNTSANLG